MTIRKVYFSDELQKMFDDKHEAKLAEARQVLRDIFMTIDLRQIRVETLLDELQKHSSPEVLKAFKVFLSAPLNAPVPT